MPGQLDIETPCDAPDCKYLSTWSVHWIPDQMWGTEHTLVTRRLCTLHVCGTWVAADEAMQLQLDYGA